MTDARLVAMAPNAKLPIADVGYDAKAPMMDAETEALMMDAGADVHAGLYRH
jgi:hypothetical protein